MEPGRRDQIIGTLFVLGAITSWGAYFPYAKQILAKLSPNVFLIYRFGVGALTLLLLSRLYRRSLRTARANWVGIGLAALIGIILHQLIQLEGLKVTSATNVGWILTLIPPVTGLLGWVFLRERISWRQLVGLVVAVAGVLLFVTDGQLRTLSLIRNRGDLLILGSVGTWSVYTVLAKSRLQRLDPLPLTALIMSLGFLFFLVSDITGLVDESRKLELREWVVLILIGIIPSGLAYFWWNAGLQRLSAMNTSMFLFIEAIVASVVAFLVLGESFTLRMVGFAVLVAVGVYITQWRRKGTYGGGE